MPRPHLVLASGSPRRRQLLAALGIEAEVRPPNVPEEVLPGEDAHDAAERLAVEKARAVAASAPAGSVVLAADTLVVLDRTALGKPVDEADARRMLASLAGRRHDVVTGVAVARDGRVVSGREVTGVVFAPMDEATIARYVATGEPLDKAGAYGLQGLGGLFVERVEGTPTNVVGLPVRLLYRLLADVGLDLLPG